MIEWNHILVSSVFALSIVDWVIFKAESAK